MAINITKLTNGGIELKNGAQPSTYLDALTNVKTKYDATNIIITYGSTATTLTFPYAQIGDINGSPKPGTIEATASLLVNDVFSFGGGGGAGSQAIGITQDQFLNTRFSLMELNNTTITNIGVLGGVSGSTASRAQATTNFYSRQRRMGSVGTTAANNISGASVAQRMYGLDGYKVLGIFGTFAYNVAHGYITGVLGSAFSGAPLPSSYLNSIFMYADPGDLTFKVVANGASLGVPVDLGANFPVDTSAVDVYKFELTVLPGAETAQYRITRLNTGDVAEGELAGIPAPDVQISGFHIGRANNYASGVAPNTDFFRSIIISELLSEPTA